MISNCTTVQNNCKADGPRLTFGWSLGLGASVLLLVLSAVFVLAFYWRKQAQVVVFKPVACSRRHVADQMDPEDAQYQPASLTGASFSGPSAV